MTVADGGVKVLVAKRILSRAEEGFQTGRCLECRNALCDGARSQRGRITCQAFVTHSVRPGQVFISRAHFGATNELPHVRFDPFSRQPFYKDCAVGLVSYDR